VWISTGRINHSSDIRQNNANTMGQHISCLHESRKGMAQSDGTLCLILWPSLVNLTKKKTKFMSDNLNAEQRVKQRQLPNPVQMWQSLNVCKHHQEIKTASTNKLRSKTKIVPLHARMH
jgi:hypothetical protein